MIPFGERVAERVKLGLSEVVDVAMFDVYSDPAAVVADRMLERVSVLFRPYAALEGQDEETERVPRGWWDHLRHDHPWLQRVFGRPRYRYVVTSTKTYRMCPHLLADSQSRHLRWMAVDDSYRPGGGCV